MAQIAERENELFQKLVIFFIQATYYDIVKKYARKFDSTSYRAVYTYLNHPNY